MSENLYICGSDQSPITMSIRCLAVDDEQHALDIISRYVEKIPNLELVAATTDAIEAFQLVQKETIDLVFLDVHMPEITGIQFLKLLGGRTKVILCTAYPEYAVEGYD